MLRQQVGRALPPRTIFRTHSSDGKYISQDYRVMRHDPIRRQPFPQLTSSASLHVTYCGISVGGAVSFTDSRS